MYMMKSAGLTDMGRLRTNNEDSYAIEDSLLIVADGMGGAAAGEIASSIAVKTITEKLKNISHKSDDQVTEAVINAILDADKSVKEQTSLKPELLGMGTTVVTAVYFDSRVVIGNVGDSRAYLISDSSAAASMDIGSSDIDANAQTAILAPIDFNAVKKSQASIGRVTEDDSVVMDLVRAKIIKEEEIRTHPLRNRITQSVGSIQEKGPGITWLDIKDGDILLMCSDGLWELVHDDIILAIVRSSPNLEEMCQRLVDAANDAGGTDNITIITAEFFKE